MECEQVRNWLPFYIHGDRKGWDIGQLENHLASCRACQVEQAETKRLASLVRDYVLSAPIPQRYASQLAFDSQGLLPPPRRLHARFGQSRLGIAFQAVAITCIAFALLFALSPEVRAQTGAILRKIGELTFTNGSSHPPIVGTPPSLPPVFPYYGHSEGMTVDQARTAVPFAFHLPTWVPADYYLDDQVGVYTTFARDCNCEVGWSVSKAWVKPAPLDHFQPYGGGRISISLWISRGRAAGYPRAVVTDLATLEALTINGRPTALLGPEGVIPAEPRALGLSKALMWTEGDVIYSLRGTTGVPVDDLIHMAESVP